MKGNLTSRRVSAFSFPSFQQRLIQLGMASCLSIAAVGFAHPPATSQEPADTETTRETTTPAPVSPAVDGDRPTLQRGSQGATVLELQAMLKLMGFYRGAVNGQYEEDTAMAVATFQQAAGLQPDGVVGPQTWDRLFPSASLIGNDVTTASALQQPGATVSPATASPPATPAVTASSDTPTQRSAETQETEASPAPSTANSTAASATESPAEPVALPVLRMGMRGPAVSRLQERLRSIGVYDGAIDGIFGPATQNAVKVAQRNYQLEPDGIVGPATWSALLR